MPKLIHPQPSASSLRSAIASGATTAEKVVRDALERIQQIEPEIHAWKHLEEAGAIAQARQLDARIDAGASAGMLAGIPLAVKDLIDTHDMPTGYGSALYDGHRPADDAKVVELSRRANAVVMGKTVTTEFAYFKPGPTANPWNTAHTPGGSSSGSAAAVASGMVPLAFGSQTAGSLIRPASYCGVFAIKPTHGLVSGTGVKHFAPSLDTMGWLANSAEDLELMRAAMTDAPFKALMPAAGIRLVSSMTHEWEYADASGQEAWEQAHARLSRGGAPASPRELPESVRGLMNAQKTVMAFEAAQHLAHEVDNHADIVSQHIRDLVATGRATPKADYEAALAFARRCKTQIMDFLHDFDALMVPAAPGEAPAGLAATGDPVFSRVWTLLGLPCVNVPGLLGKHGLPIGMQLVGLPNQERKLLATAARLNHYLLG